ncbi:hypothetical protein AB4Z35_20375 [Pseudomonas sp. KB_15]|uniref:fibronectin type III domain-containing protein n=1 Tax=Pseudomonas sp. KB_15 TaxID=3233035 RepID=UPI003F9E24C2
MNQPVLNQPVLNKPNFDESPLTWKIEGVTRNTIELSWERRPGVVEYFLATASGHPGGVIYQGGDTTFTIESLKSNTAYSYFISGRNADGKSTKLALINTRTAVRGIPEAPSFFEAFGQTLTEVSFYWNEGVVDGGPLRYEIERDGDLIETPSRPPYTDTNPQQGRDHLYCIRTIDDEFHRSEPHCVIVSFKDITPPTDPSNLRVEDVQLKAKWTPSYDSSLRVTYTVDLGVDNQLGTTTEPEFTFTGLQSGKQYEIGVTASDEAGNKSNRVVIQYPVLGIPPQRK